MQQPKIDPTTNLPAKNTESRIRDLLDKPVLTSPYNAALPETQYLDQFIQTTDPGTEYDFNIVRGMDPDEIRGQTQPIWEKAIKGIGNLGSSFAFGVAEGAGLVWGLGEAAVVGDAGRIFKNSLSETLDGLKETVGEELFNVYVPPSVQNGDFLDKVTSVSFWATDGAETLGQAFAMLVPGQALKLAKLGKGIASLNIPKRFKPGWLINNIDSSAAVAVNSIYEAGVEAKHTYHQLYDSLVQEGKTFEEAKAIASDASATVFQANMALLLATNTIFEKVVFKGFNAKSGLDLVEGAAKRSAAKSNTMDDLLDNLVPMTKGQRALQYGKVAVGQTLSEGFLEEGTQFSIENYAKRKAKKETDENWVNGISKTYAANIFSNTDMNISVFLGGLIGAGFGVTSAIAENKYAQKQIFGSPEKSYNKFQQFLGFKDRKATPGLKQLFQKAIVNDYKSLFDLVDYTEVDGKRTYTRDTNNKLVLNAAKLKTFIENKKELTHALEEAANAINNDDRLKYEFAIAKLSYNGFREILSNPYGEKLLNEMIPLMAKKAAPEIQEYFAQTTDLGTIEADILKNLNLVKDMVRGAYQAVHQDFTLPTESKELLDAFKTTVFSAREGALMEYEFFNKKKDEFKKLDKYKEDPEAYDKELTRLENVYKQYFNKEYLNKLYKEFQKEVKTVTEFKENDVYKTKDNAYVLVKKVDGKWLALDQNGKVLYITEEDLKDATYHKTIKEGTDNFKLLENIRNPQAQQETKEEIKEEPVVDEVEEAEVVEDTPEQSVEEQKPEPVKEKTIYEDPVKMIEFIRNNELAGIVRELNKNMPEDYPNNQFAIFIVDQHKNNKSFLYEIDNLNNAELKAKLQELYEASDAKPVYEGEPTIPNDNETLPEVPKGRIPADMFMPVSIDTKTQATDARTKEQVKQARIASAFFHETKDLSKFQLKVVRDEDAIANGFPNALMGIVVNKKTKEEVLFLGARVIVKIPEANENRIKKANNGTPADYQNALNDFKKQREKLEQNIDSDIYLEFEGVSTGEINKTRKRKRWFEFNKGVPMITVHHLNDPIPGSVYLNGTRYFSVQISEKHSKLVARSIKWALDNKKGSLEQTIANKKEVFSTISNIIYFDPMWREKLQKNDQIGEPTFLKEEEGKLMLRGRNGWVSLPLNASYEQILDVVNEMYYQVFELQKRAFALYEYNEETDKFNKVEGTNSYKKYVAENMVDTPIYPAEIVGDEINIGVHNVYPRVSYEFETTKVEMPTELVEEGVLFDDDPFGTANWQDNKKEETQVEKPVSNESSVNAYLPAFSQGASVKEVGKEDALFAVTPLNFPIIINPEKAFKNISRNLSGLYEIEGEVNANNYDVKILPLVKKQLDGKWVVVSRGKIVPKFNETKGRIVGRKLNKEKATKYIKDRFTTAEVEFVTNLMEEGVLGYMMDGAVVLDERTDIGTVHHEAFHIFSQYVLTPEERAEMYNMWRKENQSNLSNGLVEERLAEEFREYEAKHPLAKFFDKIVKAIKTLLKIKDNSVKSYFIELSSNKLRRSETIRKNNKKYFRRSEDFTNQQLEDISDSLVGHILKTMLATSNEKLNISMFVTNELIKNSFERMLATHNSPIIISELGEDYLAVLSNNMRKNYDTIVELTKIKLKLFSAVSEEEMVEETESDNEGWEKDDALHSTIQSIPQRIRIMLGSRIAYYTDSKSRSAKFYPELGLPMFVNAKKTFAILANTLSGSQSLEEMLDRLYQKQYELGKYHDLDFINEIFQLLGYDPSTRMLTVTSANVDFQTEFFNAFANQQYHFNLVLAKGDALIYTDSLKSRRRREYKIKWKSTFIKNKERYAELKNNKWVHKKDIHDHKFSLIQDAPNPNNWDDIVDYLEFLGIQLPIAIDTEGNYVPFSVVNKIVSSRILNSLHKNILTIGIYLKENETNIHDVIYESGSKKAYLAFVKLLDISYKFQIVESENQFVDLNNNTRYTLGRNTFLSSQINKINSYLKGMRNEISDVFFDTNSMIYGFVSDRNVDEIVVETVTGIKELGPRGTAQEFDQLDEASKLALFVNNILQDRYTLVRPSDNGQERVIMIKRNDRNVSLLSMNYRNQVKNYLQNQLDSLTDPVVVKYGKLEKIQGQSIPLFNFLSEELRQDLVENGITEENEEKFFIEYSTFEKQLANELYRYLIDTELLKVHQNGIANKVFHLAGKEIQLGNSYTADEYRPVLLEIVRKQFVSVFEQMKMFGGNVAFYNNADKLLKRGSGWIGPKSMARVDSAFNEYLNTVLPRSDKKIQDGTIRVALFRDPVSSYPYAEGVHDESDAVAYITLDFQREFEIRNSTWTFKKEAVYQFKKGNREIPASNKYHKELKEYNNLFRKVNDASIDSSLFGSHEFIIPPLKPQYFGEFDRNGEKRPGMIKTAFVNVDMIKDRIVGLPQYMAKHQLDIVTFPTAVKIGGFPNPPSLFDEKGNITSEAPIIIEGYHEYIGVQVSNKPKIKDEGPTGSQQLKIVTDYISEDGVFYDLSIQIGEETKKVEDAYNDFVAIHNAIHDAYYEELMYKLGMFKQNGRYVLSNVESNFIESLRQQARERGMGSNIMSLIDDIDKYGLESTTDKLQNVLFKMVTEAVVSAKSHGTGFFQHTASLARLDNTYTQDGKVFSGSDLRFYEKDENGNVLPMQVYLPWYLKEKMPSDLDPRFLQAFGFRIPTQDMNSLDAIEIKGFLPREAGNMVIVPTQYYKKNGSDSDGDKLFIHLPSMEKGKYAELVEKSNNPSISDMMKYIRNHKEAYEEFMSTFNNNEDQKFLKEEIKAIMRQSQELTDDEYLSERAIAALIDENQRRAEEFSNRLNDQRREMYRQLKSVFAKYGFLKQYREDIKNPLALQSVAALQNRRIELERAFVLSPHNFNNLVAPLDAAYFRSIRDEFTEIYGKKSLMLHDLFNPVKLMQQTEEYMVGKSGIGIVAIHRVHHILAKIHGIQQVTNTPFFSIPSGTNSLGKNKTVDGIEISKLLSDLVNMFVDAVSDPMIKTLNLGLDTLNVATNLIRLGASHKTVVYWLNQPIIKEFLTRRATMESPLLRAQNVGENNYKTYKTILRKYGLTSYRATDWRDIENNIADITQSRLRKGLTDPNEFSSSELSMIIHLLVGFPVYKEGKFQKFTNGWINESKSLGSSMKKTAQDRTDAGKDIIEFFSKFANPSTDGIILGTMLNDGSFMRRFFDQYGSFSQILNNFFLFGKNKERLMYYMYGSDIQDPLPPEDLKFYVNHAITYVLQKNGLENRRSELLYGDDTIAHRLAEMKDQYPGNMFLRSLTPVLQPNPNITKNGEILSGVFHMRERSGDNIEELLVEHFENLYDNPETKEFAIDLAESAYLMYGHGSSPIGFTNLIPFRLREYIYNKYEYSIDASLDGYVFVQETPYTGKKSMYVFHDYENGLSEVSLTGINEAEPKQVVQIMQEDPMDILVVEDSNIQDVLIEDPVMEQNIEEVVEQIEEQGVVIDDDYFSDDDIAIISSEEFIQFSAENPGNTLREVLDYYKQCKL